MSALPKGDNLTATDLPYDTPRCNIMMTVKRAGNPDDPVYAYPDMVRADELKIRDNVAYATSITAQAQNVYSTPDKPLKEDEIAERARSKRYTRSSPYRNALCNLLCCLSMLVSLGLASSALAMALWSFGTTEQECDCVPMESHITFRLDSLEETLQETAQELARSKEEVKMLSALVVEYYRNTTAALTTPEKQGVGMSSSTNITRVVHDCNTSVEAVCTIDPVVGTCQTKCVPETQPDSITTNLQCTRLESDEQNPMIGVLDVADEQVLCLCYVLSLDGLARTHPVDCALRVTRCSLANIT